MNDDEISTDMLTEILTKPASASDELTSEATNPPAKQKRGGYKVGGGRPKGSKNKKGKTGRYVVFDAAKKRKFLKQLERHGSVRAAAASVGISRFTAYAHISKHEKFAEKVEIAKDKALSNLEDELCDRLYNGNETLEYDADDNLIKRIVKKDNDLLKIALKAQDSERYGDKAGATVSVNIDAGSAVDKLAAFLKVELPDNSNDIEGSFNRLEHESGISDEDI